MSVETRDWITLGDALARAPKIAVADDDWLNRDLLETYLTQAGCEVRTFPDGAAAWVGIQEDPPDIALLDVRMPNMDGITLCGNIKQNPQLGFIPVIVVTAYDEEDEKLRAIEAGADDFIGKQPSFCKITGLLGVFQKTDDGFRQGVDIAGGD